jgi:hypothetical protein
MNKINSLKLLPTLILLAFTLSSTPASWAAPKAVAIEGLITNKGKLSQEHSDTKLKYDLSKSIPMGGVHNSYWVACKVWDTAVAAEYAIHSMEHGAIWIVYNNSLKPAEVNVIKNLAKNDPYLLVTKVDGAKDPITVTAWGFQIKAKKANDPRIPLFIKTYKNSKTTPELGAPCVPGLTDPVLAAKPQAIKR